VFFIAIIGFSFWYYYYCLDSWMFFGLVALFVLARTLVKRLLVSLSRIHNKEVFRYSQGDGVMNESEIVLPNLTKITLVNLPNFVDFFVHKAETEEAVYVVEQYMPMSSRDKGKSSRRSYPKLAISVEIGQQL
jgi:hypothetical protein